MAVPDTSTFSMQDVVNEIGGGSDLQDLFTRATGTFDPAYVGNKGGLLNFRNYDHTGFLFETVTNANSDSNTGLYGGNERFVQTVKFTTSLSSLNVQWLIRREGLPDSDIRTVLYSVTGSLPNTILAVSDNIIAVSILPLYSEYVQFNFTNLTITSGVTYAIGFEYTNYGSSNTSNFLHVYGSSSSTYVDGEALKSNDNGASWAPDTATLDYTLKLYGG